MLEPAEVGVVEHVHAPVVGAQVVDVFVVHGRPEVLAQELDQLEVVLEARLVLCNPFGEALADAEAQLLQGLEHLVVGLG